MVDLRDAPTTTPTTRGTTILYQPQCLWPFSTRFLCRTALPITTSVATTSDERFEKDVIIVISADFESLPFLFNVAWRCQTTTTTKKSLLRNETDSSSVSPKKFGSRAGIPYLETVRGRKKYNERIIGWLIKRLSQTFSYSPSLSSSSSSYFHRYTTPPWIRYFSSGYEL